jgi:hypothetical protein
VVVTGWQAGDKLVKCIGGESVREELGSCEKQSAAAGCSCEDKSTNFRAKKEHRHEKQFLGFKKECLGFARRYRIPLLAWGLELQNKRPACVPLTGRYV